MIRSVFILLAAGLLASVSSAAEPAPLRIRFLGNAAVEITDGEFTLLSDFPYRSGAFGYMTYDAAELKPRKNAICLFTHAHADHFDPKLVGRVGCAVVGPASVVGQISGQRVISLSPRIDLPPVTVFPVRTKHGAEPHDSYLVEWNGRRLYFTGDTNSTAELMRQKRLDVLFITPWLLAAAQASRALPNAAKIIVYHHRLGETVERCPACLVPRQGQVVELAGRDARAMTAHGGNRPARNRGGA